MVENAKGGCDIERETLRGLTTGSIRMESEASARVRCIVVGDKFPSWLPHCGGLGLEVTRACLLSDACLSTVKTQVSEECIVQVGRFPTSHPLASVVLVDGPATNAVLAGATLSEATLVLSTHARRRRAAGWLERSHTLSHQDVGGVVHSPGIEPGTSAWKADCSFAFKQHQ